MKAVAVRRYGPPENAHVIEKPRPTPKQGEILVKVEATAVTAGDARIRGARFPKGFAIPGRLALGIRGPRRQVLGYAFSGSVEQFGEGVTKLAPGTAVSGMTGARMGAHAEYVVVKASSVTPKPSGVSHADAAAALFGGTTALYFLRDRAAVQAGQQVLVNGASGSVGSAAVQLARHLGARVTAVTSARNAEMVSRLGAENVIDYTSQPVSGLSGSYDVVFDAVGNLLPADGPRLLSPEGSIILAVAGLADTIRARGRVIAGVVPERALDMKLLLELVEQGVFDPLTNVVGDLHAIPDAYRSIDSGRKVGNLVVLP